MLTALFLVLVILGLLGFLRPGDAQFLRVTLFTVAGRAFTILDTLTIIAILWVVAALRGPIAIGILVLLALWILNLVGIVVIEGIPFEALVVLVSLAAIVVHMLTRHRGA